jgi:hypothetical protein
VSAVFSACGRYRHRLDRDVQLFGVVAVLVGINPSTAGAQQNDNTIAKEIGFAKVHGWSRIIKVNVFDRIATDVRELAQVAQPASTRNRQFVSAAASEADILVPCWGDRAKVPPGLHSGIEAMQALLRAQGKPMVCFGRTAGGDPRHPLMLSYETELVPF